MEIGEAVGRYEQAAALLPARWQQAARRAPEHRKALAEEFRLRTGRPMTILTCEGEMLVSDELPRDSVTQADLEQLCDAVTGYSRYAAAETMAKGYLIGRGGFRIGLCGTVAVRQDGGLALRDISSATVRISRQVRGLWQEVPALSESGFDSTLIAAPPGAGKTTLLREWDGGAGGAAGRRGGRAGRDRRDVPGRAPVGCGVPHGRAGRLPQGGGHPHAAAQRQPAGHRRG